MFKSQSQSGQLFFDAAITILPFLGRGDTFNIIYFIERFTAFGVLEGILVFLHEHGLLELVDRLARLEALDHGGTQFLQVYDARANVFFDADRPMPADQYVEIERLDLVMSPQSMWQAHTPDYMAVELANELGPDVRPSELLEKMLPDAVDGVITVERWELMPETAARIDDWIRGAGEWERDTEGPLPGIGFETHADGSLRLSWKPVELLSQATRKEFGKTTSPLRCRRPRSPSLFPNGLLSDPWSRAAEPTAQPDRGCRGHQS